MNQILVACLFVSCAAAFGTAALLLVAGWGLLFAVAAYCSAGSAMLVGSTLAAQCAAAQYATRQAQAKAARAKARTRAAFA